MNVGGQSPLNLLQVFNHAGTCPVDIRTIFKYDEDVRIIEHGLGTYGLDLRSSQQCGNNRVCDLVFDNVRGLALPARVNNHLYVRNVRQRIQGNPLHRPDACHDEQKCRREDQEPIASAPFDNPRNHVTFLPWR